MFTIEDAENDGKIKREVGPNMARVAGMQNAELYEMFEQVCEDKGMEPKDVLADGILRAIKNQEFSERIASIEVNMSSIKKGNLRIEDAKLVKEFSKQLGLDVDENDDWLEQTVRERLQAKTSSPLGQIQDRRGQNGQAANGDIQEQMSKMAQEIQRLSQQIEGSGESNVDVQEDSKQEVDDIFSGGGESGEEIEETEDDGDGDGEEAEDDEEDGSFDVNVDIPSSEPIPEQEIDSEEGLDGEVEVSEEIGDLVVGSKDAEEDDE